MIFALIGSFTYTGVGGLEPTHYCEDRELTAHCMELSSTAKTCYTLPAKTGGKRCTSLWIETPTNQEPIKIIPVNTIVNKWQCSNIECLPLT